jgi:multiple sugar transport system substrate-binding protein
MMRRLPMTMALAGLIGGAAQAEVTVVGWPGGPEETALRAVTELYNAARTWRRRTASR